MTQLEKNTVQTASEDQRANVPKQDGKRAFLVLFFCVLINMAITGMANSFGIFQDEYLQMYSDSQAAQIGWIGTVSLGMMLFGSIFAGTIIYFVGYRKTIWIGAIVAGVGLILASFSKQVWQSALTHGLIFGLGASLPFLCSISIIPLWFEKYRGFGMGAINSGGGIGGMIIPPIAQAVMDNLSFGWSLRIAGICVFVILTISGFFVKPRINKKKSTAANTKKVKNTSSDSSEAMVEQSVESSQSSELKIFDKAAVIDPFIFLVGISTLFADVAYTGPLYYLPTAIEDRNATSAQSTLTVILSNVGGVVGSLLFGYLADKVGEMNIVIFADIVVAVIVPAIWLSTTSVEALLALSFLYGMFSAGFLAIVPAILGRHYEEHRLNGVIGVVFVYVAVGIIIGGPIAGTFYDMSVSHGSYSPLAFMCTVGYAISALILVSAQIFLRVKSKTKFGFNL
ncbi:Monocarboxylate transporter 12 [Zancudomyces culisetae]|uniref:Monocarboxylate transporter 12 n=1 Tax=Zancudomyces culisetae TaxID=1213189 RepID=A0A1R1PRA5_ZANCU|nr:Monocarboxylate transporter 12 [Zancudomyces culisetae]|eukprot:OMH83422.1 Monocarboxylate transporter 12 [Zancudomyces culisetae]